MAGGVDRSLLFKAMQPLIGTTGRRLPAFKVEGAFEQFLDSPLEIFYAEYAEKVSMAGGLPVLLSDAADPEALVERLDGLLLSGGTDVAPDRYGATPGPHLWPLSPERDEFELALVRAAIGRRLPILGSCRGIQLLNVHFGGTLIAHLPPDSGEAHSSKAYPRYVGRHEVIMEPGSTMADLYGSSAMVNSYHHQGLDRVGEGLIATARARDGVVEAVEHADLPIIGVQWHPETMRFQEPIWDWFVKAAADR